MDIERKDDNDWVKCCITWEVEGIRHGRRPKKTWWDCIKDYMQSLGCPKRLCSLGINGTGKIRGQPANPGTSGKMVIKTECVCMCFFLF